MRNEAGIMGLYTARNNENLFFWVQQTEWTFHIIRIIPMPRRILRVRSIIRFAAIEGVLWLPQKELVEALEYYYFCADGKIMFLLKLMKKQLENVEFYRSK